MIFAIFCINIICYCCSQTKEVRTKYTFITLTRLEPYTKYCFYVMLQTLTRDGKLSAPSDAVGPKCVRTSAEG